MKVTLFNGIPTEHAVKISEYMGKKEYVLSERKNETEKSFVYFVKCSDEVFQITFNKESGNMIARKGNYKLDEYKWEKGTKKKVKESKEKQGVFSFFLRIFK